MQTRVTETQDALRLDPNDVIVYSNLAQAFLGRNRSDTARTTIQEALARKLDSGFLRLMLYVINFL
jgi:Flp pilus assembly protein TadD